MMNIGLTRVRDVVAATMMSLMLLAAPVAGAQTSDGQASEGQASEVAEATVDLNTATEAELVTLPGVGPSRAQAIIAYREHRPFRRVEDLMRVRGIGRATFRRLRPRLRVGG